MDNFDLKKFLKESKALENLNPAIKALNENEMPAKEKMTKEAIKKQIKDMIVAELEGKDLEDATKAAEQNPKDKKPESNLPSADLSLHMAGVKEETDTDLMDPIEELNDPYDADPDDDTTDDEKSYYAHFKDLVLDPSREEEPENSPEEDEAEARKYNKFFASLKNRIKEAKKKKDKDVENVEDVEVTDTEDISLDDIPTTEETPETSTGGGLEDIAADMKGTEGDLMDHLMKAFQIAKGMNNEKLETQVGNTLKFFVSEYIGGGQD